MSSDVAGLRDRPGGPPDGDQLVRRNHDRDLKSSLSGVPAVRRWRTLGWLSRGPAAPGRVPITDFDPPTTLFCACARSSPAMNLGDGSTAHSGSKTCDDGRGRSIVRPSRGRHELAAVIEDDHSVAQQAPALVPVFRDDARHAVVECLARRAGRQVLAHGATPLFRGSTVTDASVCRRACHGIDASANRRIRGTWSSRTPGVE